MIKQFERMIAQMSDGDIAAISDYVASVAATRRHAQDVAVEALLARNFEIVDAVGPLTPDGREALTVGAVKVALRPAAHAERMALAFEAASHARQTSRKFVTAKPGEALTSVLCPGCQSTMAKSPVCPNCSKGKAGFKILCICTECNHEVYL